MNNQRHSDDEQLINKMDSDIGGHNETDFDDDKNDNSIFGNENNIGAPITDISPDNDDHNVLTFKVNKMEGSLKDIKETVHMLVDVIKTSSQFQHLYWWQNQPVLILH